MKSSAQARIKRIRAVELAAEGHSYDSIAREVGFSHRGSAHRAVRKALSEREMHAVEELRTLEMDRLGQLQAAMWPTAMSGDLSAASLMLRVIDQRIRLLGLYRRSKEPTAGEPMCLVQPEAWGTGDKIEPPTAW